MGHLPSRGYVLSGQRKARSRPARAWKRAVTVAGAATLASLVLSSGIGGAAVGQPMPSLQSLVAEARALSNEISSLNEQYDGLRIQLAQARAEAQAASAPTTRIS